MPAAGVLTQRWDYRTITANYYHLKWTCETHLLTPAARAIRRQSRESNPNPPGK